MRTSWRRLPPKGNTLTSWKEAYHTSKSRNERPQEQAVEVSCLYEDVTPGYGESIEDAKDDYLENVRLKISELTEMLEFCAKSDPRQV